MRIIRLLRQSSYVRLRTNIFRKYSEIATKLKILRDIKNSFTKALMKYILLFQILKIYFTPSYYLKL